MMSVLRLFWLSTALIVAAIAAMVTSAAGGGFAADTEPGKKVYNAACLECHGSEGRGDGPKARKLGFHPRNFSLGSFKCRCTASGELPTDDDLLRSITRGMSGTPMQPHEKNLSEAERRAVVQYLKTLSPKFENAPAPQCLRLPSPIPSSTQSIEEGKLVYRVLQCWKCHGKSGKGDGPSSAALKDDWGNPIRAYNFTVMKRFKCGGDDTDIYRTLLSGMNGSPMPSYASALLFSRETAMNLEPFQGIYSAEEIKELGDYLSKQPEAEAIKSMPPEVQSSLLDQRAWGLVFYLQSLISR